MPVPAVHLPGRHRIHGAIDTIAVRAGSLLIPKYFRDGIDSPPVADHLEAIEIALPEIDALGEYDVSVSTRVGRVSAGVQLRRRGDPGQPTIIYHHGAGEIPFDTSCQRIFPDDRLGFDGTVIAIRAPYHQSTKAFGYGIRTLEQVVAMLATSVVVIDEVIEQCHEHRAGRICVAGTSLGGFVTNLHHIHYDTADVYCPLLAGIAMDDVFLKSVYRHGVAAVARQNPSAIQSVLNFETEYGERDHGALFPLQARFDRLVRFPIQSASYRPVPVRVIETGHVTGALAADTLRAHVMEAL